MNRPASNPYFVPSALPNGAISKELDTARHAWAEALLHTTDPDDRAVVKDEIRRILQFVVIYWEQDPMMYRALDALKIWEGISEAKESAIFIESGSQSNERGSLG